METIKSDSFAENLYRYLKEHPYMSVKFEWRELDGGGVSMEFRNTTFPSIKERYILTEFDIENAVSPDLVFSARFLNGGPILL